MRRHARYLLISALVVVIAPAQAAAQSYQLLAEFNAPGTPNGPLDMQLKDGDLYGVTQSGAIFKLTPSGTLTTLYQASSLAIFQGLVEDSDGAFRGVLIAADGAPNGAIWRYDVTTGYSLEYVLSTLDGQFPEGDLVRASDGALYRHHLRLVNDSKPYLPLSERLVLQHLFICREWNVTDHAISGK